MSELSSMATLRRCELLEPLNDAQIEALAEEAATRRLADGASLFRQDEESRFLFVVESGELSIRLTSASGEQIGWYITGAGTLLGWSAFFSPPAYVADAHAVGAETRALVVDVGRAEEIMLRDPVAAYQVMKRIAGQISARLRDLREEFAEVMAER